MSANLIVDLYSTTDRKASVSVGSGGIGPVIGQIVDLYYANTMCQMYCAGVANSGSIPLLVQTSDTLTSGSFTDPTSGLAQMPSVLLSGGQWVVNSGLLASGISSPSSPVNNATEFCSGGISFAAFQRPHRYARLISLSGGNTANISAGFISNKKTTGSGAGSTQSPGSGVISV